MYNTNKNKGDEKMKPMNIIFPFQHTKPTNNNQILHKTKHKWNVCYDIYIIKILQRIYAYNCILGLSPTKIDLTLYIYITYNRFAKNWGPTNYRKSSFSTRVSKR